MAEKLIPLHGPSVNAANYVGTNSEVSIDSGDFTLLVHDGVTPGGHKMAKKGDLGTAASKDIGTGPDEVQTNELKEFKSFDSLTSAVSFVSASPGSLKNITTASYRSKTECDSLGIDYPDGGGASYVVGTGLPLAAGLVISAGSVQLHLVVDGTLELRKLGATPSLDVSEIANSATDYAVANGIRCIGVSDNYNASQIVRKRGDVIYVGDGSISGAGFYRREVFNNTSSSRNMPVCNILKPEQHLKNLLTADAPVVVLTGSSTGTIQPDAIDHASTLFDVLEKRIHADISKDAVCYTRAIGGTTYTQLDTVASNMPDSWAQPTGLPWLEYIENLAPDAVFIVMGSNDSSAMKQERLLSVVDKIRAWTKPCDIVLITQPAPSLASVYGTAASRSDQEGRDFSAGLIRSFANFHGLGLIDSNRLANMLVDGRDLLQANQVSHLEGLALNGNEYKSDRECHNFSMRLGFTGSAAENDQYFSVVGGGEGQFNPARVVVGAGTKDFFFIQKSSAGKMLITLYSNGAAGASNGYGVITSDWQFPTDQFQLEVAVTGNTAYVEVITSAGEMKLSFNIIRHGGLFYPETDFYTLTTSPWTTLHRFSVGEPVKYTPTMLASEMWGIPEATPSIKLPYGGNGINHMSSFGNELIWKTLLPAGELGYKNNASGSYTPVVNIEEGAVSVLGRKTMWYRVGNVTTVSGSFTAENSATPFSVSVSLPPYFTGALGTLDISGVIASTAGNGNVWSDPSIPARAYCTVVGSGVGVNSYRFMFTYIE